MRILTQKGDTIVEVILAMALLTSVLLIAWGTTNRAVQIQQTAQDRTLMVNQVKEQAEIIKNLWADPASTIHIVTDTSFPTINKTAITDTDPCKDTNRTGAWYLTAGDITSYGGNTNIKKAPTPIKQVNGDASKQVWVQKVNASLSTGVPAIDFYIRACWQSHVGGGQKDENTQVLLRLNS